MVYSEEVVVLTIKEGRCVIHILMMISSMCGMVSMVNCTKKIEIRLKARLNNHMHERNPDFNSRGRALTRMRQMSAQITNRRRICRKI